MTATPAARQLDERLDRFREECRRRGIKLTHQRLVVFSEIAATEAHPDAETVFERVRRKIPTISQDTVYRTLWLLDDLGLVTTLNSFRRVRFDANTDRHHHFVCTRCGKVADVYSEEFDHLGVPKGASRLGRVTATHVELRGLCNECLRTGKE